MNDLKRIANALEHLAWPAMKHDQKSCVICREKSRPVKKMPRSVVLSSERMRNREEELRRQRMLLGPEHPPDDMFRYKELRPGLKPED